MIRRVKPKTRYTDNTSYCVERSGKPKTLPSDDQVLTAWKRKSVSFTKLEELPQFESTFFSLLFFFFLKPTIYRSSQDTGYLYMLWLWLWEAASSIILQKNEYRPTLPGAVATLVTCDNVRCCHHFFSSSAFLKIHFPLFRTHLPPFLPHFRTTMKSTAVLLYSVQNVGGLMDLCNLDLDGFMDLCVCTHECH